MNITAKLYALTKQALNLKNEIEDLKKDDSINAAYLVLLEESLSYFTGGESPFFTPKIKYADISVRLFSSSISEVCISDQIITSKKIKKKIIKYIYKKFKSTIKYLQNEINYKKYSKEYTLYKGINK